MSLVDGTDAELTDQALVTAVDAHRAAESLNKRWTALRTTELAAVNAKLRAAGLPSLAVVP